MSCRVRSVHASEESRPMRPPGPHGTIRVLALDDREEYCARRILVSSVRRYSGHTRASHVVFVSATSGEWLCADDADALDGRSGMIGESRAPLATTLRFAA